MSNGQEKNQLPQGFIKVPSRLVLLLSAQELKLWTILKGHCIQSNICHPGQTRLAKLMGVSNRWAIRIISALEAKGVLRVQRRKGRTALYEPMNSSSQGSEPQFTGVVNHSSPKVDNPGVDSTEVDEEAEISSPPETRPPADTISKKPRKRKSAQKQLSREEVEQVIDALNLEKFRDKYPTLDIDDQHERFREHFLFKNDRQTGKPNWQKWSDWNRAFHRWCKNQLQWNAEQKAQRPESFGQAPIPPAHRPIKEQA